MSKNSKGDFDFSLDDQEKDKDLRLTEDILLTSNSPAPGFKDNRWMRYFGFVIARPHEYLIHIRKGKLIAKSSGQAKRCFKWPGDTVVIIPTSLKQLIFESGQITLDNIHVRIRGSAIYRITKPEKTYERISFWDRTEGEKKLARIIGEPCRSHTKWLVSNMTMEDCIRKRKESIADILLKELRLTINEEITGVSILAVDIQDVRFGDDNLFESFLAPSKEKILKDKDLAELEKQREVKLQKLEQEKEYEEKKKENDMTKLAYEAELNTKRFQNDEEKALAERKLKEAETRHGELINDLQHQNKLKRDRESGELQKERELADLEIKKQKDELEIETLERRSEIENSLTPASLEKTFLHEALPSVAKAVASSLEDSKVTVYNNNGDSGGLPFELVLNEVMNILRNRINRLADEDERGTKDSEDGVW